MKDKTAHIDELHRDLMTWSENLRFFRDDLQILKNRLAEIASKYTDKEVLASVEHFQNAFYTKELVIHDIMHEFDAEEKQLTAASLKQSVAIDRKLFPAHPEKLEQYESFEKSFKELKHEFMQFASAKM